MRRTRLTCDCGAVTSPHVGTLGELARLQLEARRGGCIVELRAASPELLELLGLCGLSEVLPLVRERQPEQREQAGGVEEEGELHDPAL